MMSRRSTMVTYNNNNNHQGQQDDTDGPVDPKLVIMLFVLFMAILFLLCLCSQLWRGTEEQEQQDAVHGRQRRQGWDSAPSMVATAVEVAPAAVQAAGPPLVCTYRRGHGWEEGSCGVCLADLADGEAVWVLPACMHYFHAACVGEWLRAHDTCPLCRAPVYPAGGAMC